MAIKLLAGMVLVWFGFQSLTVLADFGYLGFFEAAQANTATDLLLADVTIFVILTSVWMVRDARGSWRTVPFVALAVGFGAAGPLAYLLCRSWAKSGSRPDASPLSSTTSRSM